VHTSRIPVGSDGAVSGCLRTGAAAGGLGDAGGAAGGSGMVPAGSAAMVPSTVQANGPGPLLICACTDVSESEIRYACPPSMSATMP
jgi:hypothetical protein